jgi:hypothetical protein
VSQGSAWVRATGLTYEVRLWTPVDMLEEYWREWGVWLLVLDARLEKVFVAAIVVVVRGLKLAASSDDVGLRLRAADLARRARLKTVRADMVECVGVYI